MLSIYKYFGFYGAWAALPASDIINRNAAANTITFKVAPSGTPYALFGSEPEEVVTIGGGGGGGSDYRWQCTEWSACSPSGVQTRTCTNIGLSPGTFGKPAEEQSCTYVSPAGGEEGEEAEEEAEEEAPQEEAAPGPVAATTGGGLAGITGRFIQNVFGGGANAAVGIFMVLLTVVGGLVFYSKVWKKRK